MSDPNMDAADNYCSIQERAFEDFMAWEKWRDDNDLPVPADMAESADMYARACEAGSWPRKE